MADERLDTILAGYANFLLERGLTVPRQRPCLVRWVGEFLLFARRHRGYTFEETLDLFLGALQKRNSLEAWQIEQAASFVRIYR